MARSILALLHDQAQQLCELTKAVGSRLAGVSVSGEQEQVLLSILNDLTRIKQQLSIFRNNPEPPIPAAEGSKDDTVLDGGDRGKLAQSHPSDTEGWDG